MKNKGKKLAAALILAAMAMTGSYGGIEQEEYEQQKAFAEHLAKKQSEFEQTYNEIKQANDAMRAKFDQCKDVSETELRELLAKERSKRKASMRND